MLQNICLWFHIEIENSRRTIICTRDNDDIMVWETPKRQFSNMKTSCIICMSDWKKKNSYENCVIHGKCGNYPFYIS